MVSSALARVLQAEVVYVAALAMVSVARELLVVLVTDLERFVSVL